MTDDAWWRRAVIYQVYPRSFQDSNGDGVGDLNGIAQRLDHLARLGVDAVWISPIFPSPMRDFGYDVSDYCAIDPLFGSLADFDALLEPAHARGLKVILDFVPNHTSDQHPWFQESRASKLNPKRDWYVWRDPKPDGSPPNNWESEFGGPAWTFDEATGQYYYHAYLKEQPDLNWRNPEVERPCATCCASGSTGASTDSGSTRSTISTKTRRAATILRIPTGGRVWRPNERWLQIRTIDQPGVHASIRAMRQVADAYPDRVMIGEAYLPIDRLMAYYGADLTGFHLPFNFHLISTDWKPQALASLIEAYEAALPAGRMAELGARQPRPVARREPDRTRAGAGRGDAAADPERNADDLPGRGDRHGGHADSAGPGAGPVRTQRPGLRTRARSRAHADALERRTPTAASPTGGLGFRSMRTPTCSMSSNQADDPRSMLSLYRALIRLRRDNEALSIGDCRLLSATEHVLAYERRLGGERVTVALNMTGDAQTLRVADRTAKFSFRPFSTSPAPLDGEEIRLRADEGLVLRDAASA